MQKILTWFVVSSSDPQKLSLTLRAGLGALVTVITMAAGLANIPVGDLTPVVDGVISFTQAVVLAISLAISLYGAVRKVYITMTSGHPAL